MPVETLSISTRPASKNNLWIEIHLDRLLHNLDQLKVKVRPYTRVMAVIKANAYGHGLVPVAQALQGKVDFLGIGSLKEASILREQGITAPLFLFGRLFQDEVPIALQMNLTLTVSSLEEAQHISEASLGHSKRKKTPIHIKVDTGMGRLGIPLRFAPAEIEKISGLPALELEGIYTHFPTAEKYPDSFTVNQLDQFEQLIQALRRKDISFALRHAANSAGALCFQSTALNLVRPGIALYGIHPHPLLAREIDLEPVLCLKSRIAFLKQIQTGESIGYGREFIATEPTTIATLPIGYAHGYPVHLSGKGEAIVKGRKVRQVGRVCMDSMMLNLGLQTDAAVGDEVTLLGESGDERLSAQELATLAGTIPYEIVTRLDATIPRLYL